MPIFSKKPELTAEDLLNSNIGEVLKKLGAITDEDLSAAIAEQERTAAAGDRKREKLGEVLVRMKKITVEDLEAALNVQRKMREAGKREGVLSLAEAQVRYSEARVRDASQMLDACERRAAKA